MTRYSWLSRSEAWCVANRQEIPLNICVIGGAGYIGSHAVKLLLEKGHVVSCIDNLSNGHRAAVERGGVVTAVDPAVDPAGLFRVKLEMDNSDGKVPAGTPAVWARAVGAVTRAADK